MPFEDPLAESKPRENDTRQESELKEKEARVIEKKGGDWQLAYKRNIGSVIKEKPGILRDSLRLIGEAEKLNEGGSAERDGITVTYFKKQNWSHSFKVEFGDNAFFVRKELGRGTGAKAMKAFVEAEDRIRGRNDIRLINYQIGYTDKSGNDYFVAKWENLPVAADYLGQELGDEERKFIAEKLGYVYDTFHDYKDVTTDNMFYDPEKKQIVLYDLEKSDPKDEDAVE